MQQDHLLINYKLLAIEILSKALDDLCPKYVEITPKMSKLEKLAAERCLQVCGEVHKGQVTYITEAYDQQWDEIVRSYLTKRIELEKGKASAVATIFKTDNTDKVDKRLTITEDAWDKRRQKLEEKIRARRRGFASRVESQLNQKYTQDEVDDLRMGMESQISRNIREFEKRRELAVQKVIQSRNSYRIIERMTEKEVIYDTKIKTTDKSFKRQEEIYNRQWEEEDIFGASLHWFLNDLVEVKFWCSVAGVPLPVCYHTVKARLELINYDCPELDSILLKFKTGELSDMVIPELTINTKCSTM